MSEDITASRGLWYWYFLVGGAVTALGASPVAIDPKWGLETVFGLTPVGVPNLLPLIQHWGVLVVCLGASMIVAAFQPPIRRTIATFATVEKAVMVYMVVVGWLKDDPMAGHYGTALLVDVPLTILGIIYLTRRS